MRASAALLARRLAGATPRLLAGGEAGLAPAATSAGAIGVGAATLTLTRSLWHASAVAQAAAADAAATSTSSTSAGSGPLNARAECGDVPEGHRETDLSHHVNNIGLGRRRDLTLRPDVKLTGPDNATGTPLSALLKVRRGVGRASD